MANSTNVESWISVYVHANQCTFRDLSPVHTSNNVEATSSNERLFRQSRMLLRHCCRFWHSTKSKQIEHVQFFRLCRKDEINFTINYCCCFWQQSQMLLRQSRTLRCRHCCWCGWGFRLRWYNRGDRRSWTDCVTTEIVTMACACSADDIRCARSSGLLTALSATLRWSVSIELRTRRPQQLL